MKYAANLVSAILFVSIVVLAPGVVRDSLKDQHAKADIAEINHIMYGMFSVNGWKSKISEILIAEVGKMDLKKTAQGLKGTLEDELNAVIDKLNQRVKESNKQTVGGRIKQALINVVVDVDEIKKGVPGYADAMIEQLGKTKNEQTMKTMATKELKTYLNKSFTEQNMKPVQAVLDKTDTNSIDEATQKLQGDIKSRSESLEWRSYAIMILAALLFGWAAFPRNRTGFTISMLAGTLVILLGIGVAIPMIDLEAKITELSFVLLGHKIGFENQILFFQSKSVLDVFLLMIKDPSLKMKMVGMLMVTFSIVFPILKMSCSLLHFFVARARTSRVVKFLAFKIGKWSMADVMVIAIFMAYIGFNGIVETQFNKMKSVVPGDMSFFTTNGTTLEMGYYIFFTYVILALVLSQYVHSSHPEKA